MKNNTRKEVNREPDLSAAPAKHPRPFRGVIISGLILGFIFILYLFWNADQARQIQIKKDEQSEKERAQLIDKRKLEIERQKAIIKENIQKAQVALADTRWDNAEEHLLAVLAVDSSHEEAKGLLESVYVERRELDIIRTKTGFVNALSDQKPAVAEESLKKLRQLDLAEPELNSLSKQLSAFKSKLAKQRKKANEFYKQAQALDHGIYSAEAVELLQKATELHPQSGKITKLFNKMSAYTSIIHVPSDFPTIGEALASARPRDLIKIDSGTYKEALNITKPVRIKGVSNGNTRIECPSSEAPIISINAEAKGSSLSGLVLSHTGFDYSEERFSGITCLAKEVQISGCTVEGAAGHGIAGINGATLNISFCKITNSGWDGISIYGAGSRAGVKDTLCESSMQHGIQFWSGGSGSIVSCYALKNNYCGISITSPKTHSKVSMTTCSNNREAGILISNGQLDMERNSCYENLNSGIVARGSECQVSMTANVTKKNQEAGILIHQTVKVTKFADNISEQNLTHQIAKGKKRQEEKTD